MISTSACTPLEVSYTAGADIGGGFHEEEVRFRFGPDEYFNIGLNVFSQDIRFANELFAELDEQIDRAIVRSWIPRVGRLGSFALAAASLALLAFAGLRLV